jgi:hypothetical protein
MSDTNKYSMENFTYHKSVLDTNPNDLYKHMVRVESLNIIKELEAEVLEMIGDGETEFDYSHRSIDSSFNDTLDQTFPENKANLILEHSYNVEEDKGLWEDQDPDEARQTQAYHTYKADVNEVCKEIFEEVRDRYEEINNEVYHDLDSIHSGELEPDQTNVYHIVGVNALAEYREFEGSFEEKVAQIRAEDEVGILPEDMELSKAFALDLAFRETVVVSLQNLYPAPVEPGSIEEASVICAYIEAAGNSSYGGYPLGNAYIDARADGSYDDYALVEYKDNLASALLQTPVKQLTDEQEFGGKSALALSHAFKTNKLEIDEVSAAYINSNSFVKEAAKPSEMRRVIEHLNAIVDGSIGRKPVIEDYVQVAAERNLVHLSVSDLKAYLRLMHPEVARVQFVSEVFTKTDMDVLVTGLVDGANKSKERLVRLKETLDSAIAPATPALQSFRKLVDRKLNPTEPTPGGPSV